MMEFLLRLADPWAYFLIALLAAAEASVFVGLFIPGEAAMLLGGVLVFQGRASLGLMLLADPEMEPLSGQAARSPVAGAIRKADRVHRGEARPNSARRSLSDRGTDRGVRDSLGFRCDRAGCLGQR